MNWTKLTHKEPDDGDHCLIWLPEWNLVLDAQFNCDDAGLFFYHTTVDEKLHRIHESDGTIHWMLKSDILKD